MWSDSVAAPGTARRARRTTCCRWRAGWASPSDGDARTDVDGDETELDGDISYATINSLDDVPTAPTVTDERGDGWCSTQTLAVQTTGAAKRRPGLERDHLQRCSRDSRSRAPSTRVMRRQGTDSDVPDVAPLYNGAPALPRAGRAASSTLPAWSPLARTAAATTSPALTCDESRRRGWTLPDGRRSRSSMNGGRRPIIGTVGPMRPIRARPARSRSGDALDPLIGQGRMWRKNLSLHQDSLTDDAERPR